MVFEKLKFNKYYTNIPNKIVLGTSFLFMQIYFHFNAITVTSTPLGERPSPQIFQTRNCFVTIHLLIGHQLSFKMVSSFKKMIDT